MAEAFLVDVWGDVVCPFCYLGLAQLHRALERFEHRDAVLIRHRAFELDPNARLAYDQPLAELVAAKYSMPLERAEGLHRRLEGEAEALGMRWDLASARPTNTFDAHRLIALAGEQGRAPAAVERLFAAYFCEGRLVSDRDTLVDLANELGVTGAADLLDGDRLGDDVRADERDALELGITGVPAVLLDRRFMVSGAQPVDDVLSYLERAWARREKVG